MTATMRRRGVIGDHDDGDRSTAIAPDNGALGPVLIADDSRTIRLFVQRALEQAGIRAVTAGTAEETLDALAAHEPALLLLDLSVAEHDSKALLQRLTQDGVFERVRVVLFSNRVEPVLHTTSMRLGAAGYLRKTGNPQEIVAAVAAELARAAGER